MRYLQGIFIIFIISYSIHLDAQVSIQIDSINGHNVSGSQIIVDTIPSVNIALPHLYINNNSGATKNWMITRKSIIQPNDWFNYLCWGQLCYGASSLSVWSTNTTTLNDSASKELDIYIGAPTVGNAHYRYYVSSDGINYIDSVDVIVNITITIGICDHAIEDAMLYPNPACNKINIRNFTNSSHSLIIYDYAGYQVIYQENLRSKQIDVSMLKNGSYLFVIRDNDTFQITRQKVIIAN